VPANVYSVTVECWGGGAGGGRSANAGRACGGGGGGAYAKKNSLIVTPGSSISYSIGVGGAGSSASSGNPGGDTWFSSTGTVLAKGGTGVNQSSTTGGAGGAASSSVGDVKYDGGKGGNGTGTGCCDGAGGGGSGAGSTGNGNAGSNGSSNSGWCSSGNDVYGGDYIDEYGGEGGIGVGSDGVGGGAYNYGAGGGGGKRGCASSTKRNGGNGTQGLIRITYCYAPSATNAGADVAICDGGNTTLSSSATAYSGTNQLLFQDFEASITSWTIASTGTAAASFTWTYNPITTTALGNAYSGSPTLLWANGDASTAASTTTFTSPTFSTVGFTSLSLSFRHHYNDYDAADFAYVEVYDGSAWVAVQTYTADVGTLTAFTTSVISMNSYVGISTCAIRFRYVNNDDYHWLIDDIVLTGNKVLPITYSWSPATGLSATNIANPVASPSLTQTYTLTTSHNGCSTTSDAVVVTVRPVFNGGIIASSSQIACYGTQPADITYTTAPSGGSTPRYQWYKQTGVISCPSGSFNGTGWTAVGASSTSTPTLTGATIGNITATTTFALRVDNAGTPACFDNWAGNCHVVYVSGETTPSGTLATTTSSFTCAVNDAAWHYFRNSDGELIAAINGNGQTLGNVTLKVDVDANPNVHPNGGMGHAAMCNGTNELSVRRWYTVTTANTPTATTNLKFFFTPADYSNYTTVVDAVIASSAPYTACYGSTASVGDLRLSRNETNDVSTFAVSTTNLNGFAVTPANSVEYELALSPANMRLINGASPNIITAGPTTFCWHTDGGIGAPLPVELVSFTGYNNKDQNVLNWTTASEKNSDKFEVEKSTDGVSWISIGWQKATGGNVRMDYTFTDNQPVVGNNYYRLKIIDNDRTFTYSNTINITVGVAMVNGIVKIFPNPTSGLVNIQVQSTKNVSLTLEISNLLGQKVVSRDITLQTGITLVNVDLSELSGGTYIVSYIDALGTKHQERIVKQ